MQKGSLRRAEWLVFSPLLMLGFVEGLLEGMLMRFRVWWFYGRRQ